jgi:hypothetical protein
MSAPGSGGKRSGGIDPAKSHFRHLLGGPGGGLASRHLNEQEETAMLRKFVIEREVPGIGDKDLAGLGAAARLSNDTLAQLDGIQWQHSYVTGNKTFCIYLAESEDLIREHARLSGFPANRITEVTEVIDPTTERQCALAAPTRLAAAG